MRTISCGQFSDQQRVYSVDVHLIILTFVGGNGLEVGMLFGLPNGHNPMMGGRCHYNGTLESITDVRLQYLCASVFDLSLCEPMSS